MKKSEIKKEKVDEWKKKEYAVLRQLIDKRRYEEALTLIACIADLEYDYNQHYYNEKLEESILEIALLKKEKIKTGGACVLHSGGFAALFNQY